ncbi:hypothetical protein X777_09754 [Ooceraea biroi]|uniref:Uncharacterized protein n=1 Tax=Ooceraea biroi TaxID=2015173 RepID=A0A026W653_OOCBI|nr:hypothetical protein X777_09754 [Ooceraea biroi]
MEQMEVNFENLLDEVSDEDSVLSDESAYCSDKSEDYEEITERPVPNAQLMAITGRTKMCAVYFYYSTGCSLAVCASCIIRLRGVELGTMYVVRKHEIDTHDGITGRWCSNCHDSLYTIFPCNMCPICTQ